MIKEEYLASYQLECYRPSVEHEIQRFFEKYNKYAADVHAAFISNFRNFFSLLLDMQHKKFIRTIDHITISYPFSELMCGNPQLLFEVYPDVPFMEHSIVSESFKATWVLPEWEQYTQELVSLTRKAGMINVVHESYIHSTTWALGRDLLHIVCTYLKTQMIDLPRIKEFQSLKISDNFEITFGEYMGWQRTIFAIRPSIDIFNCEPTDDLTFRTFKNYQYENRTFTHLNLSDDIFKLCTFKNCIFIDVMFCDSHFDGCDFISCQFQSIRFDGASFTGTLFQNTTLDSIQTNCVTQREGTIFCGFGQASFYNCFFTETIFMNSDWSASTFEACQSQTCSIKNCVTPELMDLVFK